MRNDGSPKVTRRVIVKRAAILLGTLITAACGASTVPRKTPVVPPAPTPTPVPAPSPTPAPPQTLVVNGGDARADDGNPGSEDRPLKTVAKAADLALANNQRGLSTQVIIYPGIYREAISLQPKTARPNAPITFQAKQTGTVTITGSDVWTGWQRQGNTNVYTHSWPYKWGMAPYPQGWEGNITLQPIVRRREMIFVNGTALTQVLSNDALKEGTFYVSEQSATVSLVLPPGVGIESATVEVATRSGLFVATGVPNLTLRGLIFTHDNTPVDGTAVTLIDCTNLLVEDCQFFWNNWAGVTFLSSPDQAAHTMTARRNIANHNGAIGMAASYVKDVLYEDNETSFNSWRGAQGGFYSWATAGMKHFSVHGGTYRRHRAASNQACGCWFDTDCTNLAIDQAFLSHNYGSGLFIEASEGPTSVTDCTICQNEADAGIYSEGGANVTLLGNILYGNTGAQIGVLKGVRPVKNWETNENLSLVAAQWSLRKNIIVGTDAVPRLVNIANGPRFFTTLASDGNIWFSPRSGAAFDVDGTGMNLATWRSVSAQDAGSQFVDPRFVNPENDDFDLRDDSPLLNG